MTDATRDSSGSVAPGRLSGGGRALLLLLATALGAVVAYAVLHNTGHAPGSHTEGAAPAVPPTPHAQRGTIRTAGQVSGTVYYPLPYASPPHLNLTAPGNRYVVTKQDELGFTWAAADLAERAKKAIDAPGHPDGAKPDGAKAPAADEELSWGAEGIPIGVGVGYPRLFEQNGSFEARPGEEGDVYFPYPHSTPPNVELAGFPAVLVADVTPLGFRWKHAAQKGERGGDGGTVRWTSKGVRATTEEYQRTKPAGQLPTPPTVLKQSGQVTIPWNGEEVEVQFPRPYMTAPNVEFTNWPRDYVITGCKSTGFRCKCIDKFAGSQNLTWVAKGVATTEVPK